MFFFFFRLLTVGDNSIGSLLLFSLPSFFPVISLQWHPFISRREGITNVGGHGEKLFQCCVPAISIVIPCTESFQSHVYSLLVILFVNCGSCLELSWMMSVLVCNLIPRESLTANYTPNSKRFLNMGNSESSRDPCSIWCSKVQTAKPIWDWW